MCLCLWKNESMPKLKIRHVRLIRSTISSAGDSIACRLLAICVVALASASPQSSTFLFYHKYVMVWQCPVNTGSSGYDIRYVREISLMTLRLLVPMLVKSPSLCLGPQQFLPYSQCGPTTLRWWLQMHILSNSSLIWRSDISLDTFGDGLNVLSSDYIQWIRLGKPTWMSECILQIFSLWSFGTSSMWFLIQWMSSFLDRLDASGSDCIH